MMSETEKLVIVRDLATELDMDRSHLHKLVNQLHISTVKVRDIGNTNQMVSAITQEEAKKIRQDRKERGFENSEEVRPILDTGMGSFYIISLDEEARPGRVKFGFATDVATRLRDHRTAAPEAKLVSKWPSQRNWEGFLIDVLSKRGKKINNEVYDMPDLEDLCKRADKLFACIHDGDEQEAE